jgi:hypothetical protein
MELNVRPENPERESFVGIAAEQTGHGLTGPVRWKQLSPDAAISKRRTTWQRTIKGVPCPTAWSALLLRGLLFRVCLHLVGHLDAGDEIEIARRTQRARLAPALISYRDRGRCPERIKLLFCGFLVVLTIREALPCR